ncbi:hypothetical protein RHMOL_Rhmol08G0077300 [Rhododendron molle]|uniref:Uncharacterized protein n=1 Tax=Rhododendron molle TaxID=49168 RepID=A0ACC0MLM0_RHOML|nr:hypothetical protein RHMOL_Rhmol08G0077300 [Rhododendron molle]
MSHVAFQVGKNTNFAGIYAKKGGKNQNKQHRGESNPSGWPWRLVPTCFTTKAEHQVVSRDNHIGE